MNFILNKKSSHKKTQNYKRINKTFDKKKKPKPHARLFGFLDSFIKFYRKFSFILKHFRLISAKLPTYR